jgi:acetyltransferase-like isoleucine patch superfamily enzyme
MFWFVFYRLIAKNLPNSHEPFWGSIAKSIRYFSASRFVKAIGKNVNIEHNASFTKNIYIGNNSGIGVNALISDEVYIGNNVMMGPDCMLLTSNHRFDAIERKYKGYTPIKPIIIEDNVWIGARVIILAGVTIGCGSTVGAGAVVSKSIPPYSVAVGNPARIVKSLI